MAWIELHQNLPNHIKLKRLAKLLKARDRDLIRAKLENLWLWCLDYRENGALSGMNDADIAEASGWNGDPTLWVRYLIECGWLDKRKGGKKGTTLKVHDWRDFAGRLIDQRAKNRDRMRRARAAHVPDTFGATRPNQTIPDQTVPNHTKPGLAPPPPSAPKSGSIATEIASKYCQMNRGVISHEKAINHVEFRLRGGMNAEAALARVMDLKNQGQKIWDVLDPITPNGNPGPKSVRERFREIEEANRADQKAIEEEGQNESV